VSRLLVSDALEVPLRHSRCGPVFVIGHARSGTSLTCRLLLDCLQVNFGTESQFFIRYHRKLASYGDLHDDRNLRLLLYDISSERFFTRTRRNFGFVLDVERALREMKERTYPAALRSIFGQFAHSCGATRWGDKTPAYAAHLPVLLEMFPDAQFIHVLRDGRDAAVSLFKVGFGPKNAYEAAVGWQKSVNAIWTFAAGLPREQFFELRYERLLVDPVTTMTDLARFLGVEEPDAVVAASAHALREYVRANNANKWPTLLTRRDIDCFEAVAGTELERGGFALAAGRARRRLSPTAALFWRLHGAFCRLRRRDYWRDNLYKLRLRARAATLPVRRLQSS